MYGWVLIVPVIALAAYFYFSSPSTTVQPKVTISADPTTIQQGESSSLTWEATDVNAISIEPGIGKVPPQGSRQVSPTTSTTYIITATGNGEEATGSGIGRGNTRRLRRNLPRQLQHDPRSGRCRRRSNSENRILGFRCTRKPLRIRGGHRISLITPLRQRILRTPHGILLSPRDPGLSYLKLQGSWTAAVCFIMQRPCSSIVTRCFYIG